MISRLLLVSVVGVLGISLPEGTDLGRDLNGTRTGATVCACRRETVTIKPISPVADPNGRIADEPNRQSNGVDVPTVRVATVAQTAAIDDRAGIVDELFAENRVWGEAAAVTPTVTVASTTATCAVVVVEKPEAPAEDQVACVPACKADVSDRVDQLFADNLVWSGPTNEPAASEEIDALFAENRVWSGPASQPEPAAVASQSIASDAVDRLFAENLVWSEPAGAEETIATEVAPARAPQPDLKPVAVAEAESSVADIWEDASEPPAVGGDEAEPSLGTALKLTHDAALAWMNVLTRTIPTSDATP